jgi:hypothetical protein
MSFDTHGFFSPAIERYRTSIRQVPTYKAWFDFADDLNGLGLDMLRDHNVPLGDNQRSPLPFYLYGRISHSKQLCY